MEAQEVVDKIMKEYADVNKFNRKLTRFDQKIEHVPIEKLIWHYVKPNKKLAIEVMDLFTR